MTVTATNRKQQFTTNGVTTEFTFDFAITDASQVYAYTVFNGVESEYTDFTVIASDDVEGGTLTTNSALSGVDLLIYRDVALTQQVDYESGGRFPADSHEQALDKLTLQNQDQEEGLSRALKVDISQDVSYSVGELEDGKFLVLNGSVIESSDDTEVQDIITGLIESAIESSIRSEPLAFVDGVFDYAITGFAASRSSYYIYHPNGSFPNQLLIPNIDYTYEDSKTEIITLTSSWNGGYILAQVLDLSSTGAIGSNWSGGDQPVSVTSYGAGVGGDDATAFEIAIKAAKKTFVTARNDNIGCTVYIPDGEYTLDRLVDNDNVIPTFITGGAVRITNADYLIGRLVKQGRHLNSFVQTNAEDASGFSTRIISGGYRATDDYGLDNDNGTGSDDAVALTATSLTGENQQNLTNTVFTNSNRTVNFGGMNHITQGQLVVGSRVYVNTTPGYAKIEEVGEGYIVVDNWKSSPGAGATVVPTDGERVYVNHSNKIWGMNINTLAYSTVGKVSSVGAEIGQVTASQPVSTDLDDIANLVSPYSWGYDAVMLGGDPGSIGHIARNDYVVGFGARDTRNGFVTMNSSAGRMTNGFVHRNSCNKAFVAISPETGESGVVINKDGSGQFGYSDGTNSFFTWDFRLKNEDFDSRFYFYGGDSEETGRGVVGYYGSIFEFNSTIRPTKTSTYNLGQVGFRWAGVYLVNSPDVSSDETLKSLRDNEGTLSDAEKQAAIAIAKLPRIFKWLSEIEEKSESETVYFHCSPMVQKVIAAFEDAGLDYTNYGMVNDGGEDGTMSLQPQELLWMICAAQQEQIEDIQTRLLALEG